MSNTNQEDKKLYQQLTLAKMQDNPQLLDKLKGLTEAEKLAVMERVGRRMVAKARLEQQQQEQPPGFTIKN